MAKKNNKKKSNINSERILIPVSDDGRNNIPINIKILHQCNYLEPIIKDGELFFKAIKESNDENQE